MLMRFIFIIMLLFTSIASAEVKTYNGTGEYIMSEFETLDIAKQRAKQKAERHAQEQAGVYVSSYTKVKNAQVSEDEIITITSGIMNVVDVDYEVTPLDKGKSIHIVAKIKANIDTDDINKWLAKGVEEPVKYVSNNKRPIFDVLKIIHRNNNPVHEAIYTKSDLWEYEDEVRIFCYGGQDHNIFPNILYYKPNCLKEVIFGANVTFNEFAERQQMISKISKDISFSIATLKKILMV